MEPIKIQIELTAADKVLDAVKHVTDMLAASKFACSSAENFQSLMDALRWKDKKQPAEAPSTTQAEQAPAEPAEAAPAPQNEPEEVTDDDMTDFIRVWKTKVPAAEIKKIFSKYGCTSSTGCPKDKRAAMMNDIKALANA